MFELEGLLLKRMGQCVLVRKPGEDLSRRGGASEERWPWLRSRSSSVSQARGCVVSLQLCSLWEELSASAFGLAKIDVN